MLKKITKAFKTCVTSPILKFVWRALIDVVTIVGLVVAILAFMLG